MIQSPSADGTELRIAVDLGVALGQWMSLIVLAAVYLKNCLKSEYPTTTIPIIRNTFSAITNSSPSGVDANGAE